MSLFFIPQKKIFELLVLFVVDAVVFFIWKDWSLVVLFSMGFIWNWVAAQQFEGIADNSKKYRFSTLKTVFNLQKLFLRPVANGPWPVKLIAKSLPAGLFWYGVIIFNDSDMPWWAVFVGSLTVEILQINFHVFHSKEVSK